MTSKLPWQGPAQPKRLSDADFEAAARELNCEPAAIRAVWDVEAAGRGFLPDNTLVRRFEPHHVRGLNFNWKTSLKLSTAAREKLFRETYATRPEEALRATSWGAPQIMGFNATAIGYPSAEAMVRDMATGEPAHLRAFTALVKAWKLGGALRAHDWVAFARRYNGSGQPEAYARKIEAAFRRHSGRKSPVVLRVGDRGPAVRELQTILGLRVDGVFGPRTHETVVAFQRARGLVADGIVGAMTWEALTKPVAAEGRAYEPPAQLTDLEALTDRVEKLVAVGGSAIAVVGGLRAAVPDWFFHTTLVGGLAAGGVALALLAWRRWR
jgi:hypothetical protein